MAKHKEVVQDIAPIEVLATESQEVATQDVVAEIVPEVEHLTTPEFDYFVRNSKTKMSETDVFALYPTPELRASIMENFPLVLAKADTTPERKVHTYESGMILSGKVLTLRESSGLVGKRTINIQVDEDEVFKIQEKCRADKVSVPTSKTALEIAVLAKFGVVRA
jgi:hypothetical protein